MHKILVIAGSVLGVVLLLSSASFALAEGRGSGNENSKAKTEYGMGNQNSGGRVDASMMRDTRGADDNEDTDELDDPNDSDDSDDDFSAGDESDMEDEDKDEAEHHRSRVSAVVAHLHDIADHEDDHDGIGEDVRMVAQEQASSSEASVAAMHDLDSESFFKKLILGPNYKNIGHLRSSIVTTQNHIDRLERALASSTDAAVKTDLQAQIDTLEDVASSTQAFVQSHENVLSFLGWFFRLLNN